MANHKYEKADKYSLSNALQYNFAMKLLSKIALEKNSRILDLGCGDGLITHEIATIVPEGCVIGTDFSEHMVDYASKKYESCDNLRFLVMDARKNIFREQFDIITSFNCLHWIKDQQSVLNGIAKSAVQGAQIALLFSHKKSLYHLVLDKLCSNSKWKNYFIDYVSPRSFFDPNEYKEWIIKSGLEIEEFSEEEMIYTFKSKQELKDFFFAAGSQIKQIPEKKQAEFLNDFATEYLNELNNSEEDPIPVGFWCLQIVAIKPKREPELTKSAEYRYQPMTFSKL